MNEVIITQIFIRDDIWILVEIDLIVIFETIQDMLKVFRETGNIECCCYNRNQVVCLWFFELFTLLSVIWVTPVSFTCDESQFCGHCEMGNRYINSFIDLFDESEFNFELDSLLNLL